MRSVSLRLLVVGIASLLVPLVGTLTIPGSEEGRNSTRAALPSLRLPYLGGVPGQPYWTGGLHSCRNDDPRATFQLGQGSGLDFSTGATFDVLSMATGEVVAADCTAANRRGFGCIVAVRHGGNPGVIVYAHLEEGSVRSVQRALENAHRHGVPLWAPVGAVVGRAGDTGQQESVHLHIELGTGSAMCDPGLACLSSCIAGNPADWSNTSFEEGYRFFPFVVDPARELAYNYDASAVRGATKEIWPFPFLDGITQERKTAAVTVHKSFQCDPEATTCENNRYAHTQFAQMNHTARLPSANNVRRILMAFREVRRSSLELAHPGSRVRVILVLQNLGPEPWQEGAYELACTAGCENVVKAECPSERRIAPSDTVTFTIRLRAPKRGGLYRTLWRLRYQGEFVGPAYEFVLPVGTWREWLRDRMDTLLEHLRQWFARLRQEIARRVRAMVERELRQAARRLTESCCGVPLLLLLTGLMLRWHPPPSSGDDSAAMVTSQNIRHSRSLLARIWRGEERRRRLLLRLLGCILAGITARGTWRVALVLASWENPWKQVGLGLAVVTALLTGSSVWLFLRAVGAIGVRRFLVLIATVLVVWVSVRVYLSSDDRGLPEDAYDQTRAVLRYVGIRAMDVWHSFTKAPEAFWFAYTGVRNVSPPRGETPIPPAGAETDHPPVEPSPSTTP